MCLRVLVLFHHRLFAEAVRLLLSREADVEVHVAPLEGSSLDATVEAERPAVVVLEHPSSGEPDWALLELVGRVPRLISLGLADNSLRCVEGTTIMSAGPDDLLRAVREVAHHEQMTLTS